MKRIKLAVVVSVFLLSLVLVACGTKSYTIEFIDNGAVYASLETSGNESITMPTSPPNRDGLVFAGWYFDDETFENELTKDSYLNKKLTGYVKVYALWEPESLSGTVVELEGFVKISNEMYSITVGNNVTQYDFNDKITISRLNSYALCSDLEGTAVPQNIATLVPGYNIFYLTVTSGEDSMTYILRVRRRPMYTVTFNTEGGTVVQSQSVEEGHRAVMPSVEPQRDYCIFEGWDFNFNTSITAATTINAIWRVDFGGDGSYDDPYILTDIVHLKALADNANSDPFFTTGKYFELKDSIYLTEDNWTPIGKDESHAFNGIFNGNGYSIHDVHFRDTTDATSLLYFGLFGYNKGRIENLSVSFETKITSELVHIGGIAGYNDGGTITNCDSYVNVNITVTALTDADSIACVGSITGVNERGAVINSEGIILLSVIISEFAAATSQIDLGGLVGCNEGGLVVASHSEGSITGTIESASTGCVGGLIGKNTDSARVYDSYTTVRVTLFSVHHALIGGLVGRNSNSSLITNCYASSNITAKGVNGAFVGGLIGENISGSSAVNCLIFNYIDFIYTYKENLSVAYTVGKNDNSDATIVNCYRFESLQIKDNGVIVESSNFYADPCTIMMLNSVDFYRSLNWNEDLWDLSNISFQISSDGTLGGYFPRIVYYRLESNVISIGTAAELLALSGTVTSLRYKLVSNIDLGGAVWTPFESCISFDGGGSTISNFVINEKSTYSGFISKNYGTVKELNIANASISFNTGATLYAGALVGYGAAGSSIINCTANSSIDVYSYSYYDLYIGGLAGCIDSNAIILNSSSTGQITAASSSNADMTTTSTYAGGLVGYVYGGHIEMSFSTADVIVNAVAAGANNTSASAYAGGLVAYASLNSRVVSCYASGTVTAEALAQTMIATAMAGGLIGFNYDGEVENCYSNSNVEARSYEAYSGGLIGANSGDVVNCVAVGDATAVGAFGAFVSGMAGYNVGGSVVDSYRSNEQVLRRLLGEVETSQPTNNTGTALDAQTLISEAFYLETLGFSEAFVSLLPL